MENFLSILVFILPGLMTYFWIQLFGITPANRYQGTEILAISAILWVPNVFLIIFIYNSLLINHFNLNADIIRSARDLMNLSNNIIDLALYTGLSFFTSIVTAIVVVLLYRLFLWLINIIRKLNKKAKLSINATVWDEVFTKDEPQIVAVSKIDSPEKSFIIGEIKNVSRPLEPERNLSLRHIDHWTTIVKEYNIPVKEIFIDTKSGIVIKIFDEREAKAAQEKYNRDFTSS